MTKIYVILRRMILKVTALAAAGTASGIGDVLAVDLACPCCPSGWKCL